MRNLDKVAEQLFNEIRGRYSSVTTGDAEGNITSAPSLARFYEFDFKSQNNNLGKVSVSLDEKSGVTIMYNKDFTEEELSKISSTRGSIEQDQLIISKGQVVEDEQYTILNSLKSEYESQVWNTANYNWVLVAYTLLVALALLMLLLFLRKYRMEVFLNNTKVTFIFFNINHLI